MEMVLERERELAAVERLLERGGGVLVVEGRAGIGKTSLVDVACRRAELDQEVLRGRGSELEADFTFGVVRQLFERRLAGADVDEREALLAGPAVAVRPLLFGEFGEALAYDTSFAVLHGLYWLAANLAARRPLLIAVDYVHWADEPSLRWLAYLALRLEGLAVTMLVALRPGEPALTGAPLLAVREEAATVLRPALLSEGAVSTIVRVKAGGRPSDELCAALYAASGGNPLYLTELLRALELVDRPLTELDQSEFLVWGLEGISGRVVARVRGLDPHALDLARALAVLGDGCELRNAAAIAGVEMADATRLAGGLVRLEVLAADDPPRFIHPVIRDALEASLGSDGRDLAHRSAARLLHADGPRRDRSPHISLVSVPRAIAGCWRACRRRRRRRWRAAHRRPRPACWVARWPSRHHARSESASCARRLARRRAPGARRRACAWRRRCGLSTTRGSALRSRSTSPRRTRVCFGG